MSPADSDDGFFSRWSRRKAQVRRGEAPVDPVPAPVSVPVSVPAPGLAEPVAPAPRPLPVVDADAESDAGTRPSAHTPIPEPVPAPPPPTLQEAHALEAGADVQRFVARGVDPSVKNAALKRLFADPHYNVMDGLDIYIDDYSKPDLLPASWIQRMAGSKLLGLIQDEAPAPPAAALPADASAAHPAAPIAAPAAPFDAQSEPAAEDLADEPADPPVDPPADDPLAPTATAPTRP